MTSAEILQNARASLQATGVNNVDACIFDPALCVAG